MYVTHIINQSGQVPMQHYNVNVQQQQLLQNVMNNNNNATNNNNNIVSQQISSLLTDQIQQQVSSIQVVAPSAIAPVVADQQQPQQPPVKKRAKKACLNCRSSKVACDHNRPCLRCTKHGIEDSCLDIPRKPKVVGKRLKKDANSSPSSALVHTTTEPIILLTDNGSIVGQQGASAKKVNSKVGANAPKPQMTTYPGIQDTSSLVNSIKNNPHLQQQIPHYLNLTSNNNNKSQPPSPTNNQGSNIIQSSTNGNQQMFKFVGTTDQNNNVQQHQQSSPQQHQSVKEENDITASGNPIFIPYVFNSNIDNKEMSSVDAINKSELSASNNNSIQFMSSPTMNGTSPASSIPSSPQSAFSTPSPSISAYSSDSSPASPHAHFDMIFQTNASLDYQHLHHQQQQQHNQHQQLNNSSSLCHPYVDTNNEDTNNSKSATGGAISPIQTVVENVCANLSNLISTSSSFQEPIGVGSSPFGYCMKSPFSMDGTPQQQQSAQQQQQQLQLAYNNNNNNQLQQQLIGDNVIQSILNSGNFFNNHNTNSNSPVHTILPDVLVKNNLPLSRWAFPDRNLLDMNDSFAKLLGFKSEEDLRTYSPQLTWDDIVHFQVIQFTNRYALEAVVKGIRKFQRPCLFKHKQGGYLSATILVAFDTCYQSFEVSILQKHNETREDISSEYVIREYRFKNACLELDDINH
ncbi:hypothetical protein PPL_05483 [Heterostelium album PN500]|uniref:Zn(2)-C6 fungal-type domain-containing protein n=1 Tax=Heterostelium pallidum (strain ATCC 26659 / Pp 5 / PN500) TaxID=670386 RepID=D3BAA8_HETP5|nr:hypothetical protein PPL_05483 [Heterostelium album PN500]EFA81495.1 hypothetical protein PPL_05483 [Heterostelium album PN500]|eukprot:XP_020433613.1 hypothetical protein PPL_05483 [Heterostelium album PN500]